MNLFSSNESYLFRGTSETKYVIPQSSGNILRKKPLKYSFVAIEIARATQQWWAKWRLSTFDLYPWGEGHGVQGQICDILRSQLPMNRFLPYWTHRFPHFGYIYLGGGGVGRALILGRCRAFDLFASVDAHLCDSGRYPGSSTRKSAKLFLFSEFSQLLLFVE